MVQYTPDGFLIWPYTPDDTSEFYSKEQKQATRSRARLNFDKLTMF